MQSRISLPLRFSLKEQHRGCQLSPAQIAAVHWAEVDDYQALLDLDCGEGQILSYFLDRFSVRACGMNHQWDPQEPRPYPLDRAEILRVQQHDIPWRNNSFDVVFLTRFNHHQQRNKQMFEEVLRVLKPGGRFIISLSGLLLMQRLAHMARQTSFTNGQDNPFLLMDQLGNQGFVDVSMRSSKLRHTTVIAHKSDVAQ